MKKFLNLSLPIVLGLTFLISAITKLASIDDFHVFIYGLNILDLNYSMIFTQAIIGVELSIGILFLSRTYLKTISYFAIGLTILFSIFIFYLEIINSTEDCHCFGTAIQLSNTASTLKNIAIILLAIFTLFNTDNKAYKHRKLIIISSLFLGFSIPVIVRPPDVLFVKNLSTSSYYYKPAVEKFIYENKLQNRKVVICFFSTGCKYCKLAAKKISVISEKTANNNIFIALWNTKNDSEKFLNETGTSTFENTDIDVTNFLKLTNGTIPLIILYNDGIIEKAFRYKDIDEYKIINFLEKQ